MKKKILILGLIAVLLMAVPASAKSKEPVGVQINLLTGSPTSVPAGDAFHLSHGWSVLIPDEGPVGAYNFRLEVDGVPVEADFALRESSRGRPTTVTVRWVFNFPAGMTGTHTFTGHWDGPCQVYFDPATCPAPNATVEVFTNSLTVTFP